MLGSMSLYKQALQLHLIIDSAFPARVSPDSLIAYSAEGILINHIRSKRNVNHPSARILYFIY